MLKLDVRDKKPKIYNVAVLGAVTAIVTAILYKMNASPLTLSIVIDVFFVVLIGMLINAFFRQIEYNLYSYNTIYYAGFAGFAAVNLKIFIELTLQILREPAAFTTPRIVIRVLLDTGWEAAAVVFPFMVICCAALCISNIALIMHEGFRITNLLGIVLSFLVVGGAILLCRFCVMSGLSERGDLWHDFTACILSGAYVYFVSMLFGTIVVDLIAAFYKPMLDKDFIIILGCQVRADGTPTPLLRGRVDRAIAFAKLQKEKTGKDVIFITSGGKGTDEINSESASMKGYLLSQGIPEERIIEEDRSTTTYENMLFSREKILERKSDAQVAFSTTNFHVFRSGIYARRVKMRAVGMGAKTKWYYWPNAAVREFACLLASHKLKQAVVLCGLIAVYVTLMAAYLL